MESSDLISGLQDAGSQVIHTEGIRLNSVIYLLINFLDKASLIVYLYGPIGVLIGANFILFALTIIALCEATRDTTVARRNQAKQK